MVYPTTVQPMKWYQNRLMTSKNLTQGYKANILQLNSCKKYTEKEETTLKYFLHLSLDGMSDYNSFGNIIMHCFNYLLYKFSYFPFLSTEQILLLWLTKSNLFYIIAEKYL